MSGAAFLYPGSKSKLADWIISQFPGHQCYAEPFTGSAAVFFSKSRSKIEVLNDINGDIVHFFETVRDHGDDLADWVQATPYSRERYEEWVTQYYTDGDRPNDDIERAGRFFFTLQAGFTGGFNTGFSTQSCNRNPTRSWIYKPDDIRAMRDRLCRVVIEHLDYTELVAKYDGPETLFYFDPPYLDAGDALYSHEGEFDHQAFVEVLHDIDGHFVASYMELPDGLDDFHLLETTEKNLLSSHGNPTNPQSVQKVERLVLNYDPESLPQMARSSQQTLTDSYSD